MCVCLGLCSFITCADLCNYHHSQIENSPIAKIPLVTHIHLLLFPPLPIPANHSSILHLYHFVIPRIYINRIMEYTEFCNSHFSLNIILVLRIIQVVTCINSSFLFHGTRTIDPLI